MKTYVVAAAAALALTGSAAGMGMHPNLGASLSGMGKHAVVNLHVSSGKVCWTFEPGATRQITRVTVHVGTSKRVLLELGMHYTAKGCTTASAMTVQHLESKPGSYWVFVDTKGHPGELRGKLFAGMAHM